MRRIPLHIFLFCCWSVCVSAAFADQVTLKNGDRLSGNVVNSDGKVLVLKTEYEGDVKIQWEAITAIESSQNLNVTLKDGKRLSGKVATRDNNLIVTAAAPSAETSAPKETVTAIRNDAEQKSFDAQAEKMAHPKFTYFWSGLFDTGLALTRGNSSTSSFTIASKAVRETPRDKLTAYANYIFANDDTLPPTRTTANALRAGIRGDLNLTPRVFVFAFTDFETDELQHLDIRNVFGGGFGYHVIKSERTTFDVFGGLSYDRDSFGAYVNPSPPPATVAAIVNNSAEALIGEEFNSKLNSRTNITERLVFYPVISDSALSSIGDYRLQFDSTMATRLNNWLSWQFTFSDRYISYPPTGLKANDLLLSTGLRVQWGKAKL